MNRFHAIYLDFRALGWSHEAAIELAEIHIRLEKK